MPRLGALTRRRRRCSAFPRGGSAGVEREAGVSGRRSHARGREGECCARTMSSRIVPGMVLLSRMTVMRSFQPAAKLSSWSLAQGRDQVSDASEKGWLGWVLTERHRDRGACRSPGATEGHPRPWYDTRKVSLDRSRGRDPQRKAYRISTGRGEDVGHARREVVVARRVLDRECANERRERDDEEGEGACREHRVVASRSRSTVDCSTSTCAPPFILSLGHRYSAGAFPAKLTTSFSRLQLLPMCVNSSHVGKARRRGCDSAARGRGVCAA